MGLVLKALIFNLRGRLTKSLIYTISLMDSRKNAQEGCNADEYLLKHTLLFAESLKDLRNIRGQMYSAAEHFELSYKNHQHQQLVEETLRDYITKALISTVDHLGSVAYKVDSFLEEKVNEISSARLQFSGIEQRLRATQQFSNLKGRSRQSFVADTTKHYKCYSIPDLESHERAKLQFTSSTCALSPQDEPQMQRLNQDDRISQGFQLPGSKPTAPLQRKGHSRPHSAAASPRAQSFSFMRVASIKEIGKRAISPIRFPLQRSESTANRSTSPSTVSVKQRNPSVPRRPDKVTMNMESSKRKDIEVYSRKTKHLFKALLSVHMSKKQAVANRFNDGK